MEKLSKKDMDLGFLDKLVTTLLVVVVHACVAFLDIFTGKILGES